MHQPVLSDIGSQTKSQDEDGEEDDEDEEKKNPEKEIEAMLEEEFPPEEPNDDLDNEEMEEIATDRLQMDIVSRFGKDENNLSSMMVLNKGH